MLLFHTFMLFYFDLKISTKNNFVCQQNPGIKLSWFLSGWEGEGKELLISSSYIPVTGHMWKVQSCIRGGSDVILGKDALARTGFLDRWSMSHTWLFKKNLSTLFIVISFHFWSALKRTRWLLWVLFNSSPSLPSPSLLWSSI